MAHTGIIIYMRNVPGSKGKFRALCDPLYCENIDGTEGYIPKDFIWNGSSSGILSPLFPRHNHPIASCRHDYRCGNAKTKKDRKFADKQFEKDVGTTSWWITKKIGYIGVRIGSFFGVGWSK